MAHSSNSPAPAGRRTVFLAAEIGVGIRYFCQTGLLRELLKRGLEVVVLVPNPDEVKNFLAKDYPSVPVEHLRRSRHGLGFGRGISALVRSMIHVAATHLRMTGMSRRMNLAVTRDYRRLAERRWRSNRSRQRFLIPLLAVCSALMRRFRAARRAFESLLDRRPIDNDHAELFERYSPSLVVVSSAGWWLAEEVILREARLRGVRTLGVVPGWDHPSSKGLPGARPDRVVAWSDVQRDELVNGSDFNPAAIEISGPVHFDLYRDPGAITPRAEYMHKHKLDDNRRLITFGCTFVGMSPNLMIVQALAEAVENDAFGMPVQLLVRLHPTHFKPPVGRYREVREEAEKFYELAKKHAHVRIDEPLLGTEGVANFTNPEDGRSLASLFAHTDVFVTLFSTMVLESCFNNVPVVATAFDPPVSNLEDFLPISHALDWPTHDRIIRSGAATVVRNPSELVKAVRNYLENPTLHSRERTGFATQECTFLDGRCAPRLAEIIERVAGTEAAAPALSVASESRGRHRMRRALASK